MKKRGVLIVCLAIFGFMLVSVGGCSEQNKTIELKTGKYVMEGAESEAWSWVLLKENKQFLFNRRATLSYTPIGTYSIQGNILTLVANEDETYAFIINGDRLIFKDGDGVGNLIEEGTVYKLSNKE